MASRFLTPFGRGGDPLLGIYREMNRMFDDVFSGSMGTQGGAQGSLMAMPSLDVHEKDGQLEIAVELPGVRGEDVDVRLERDVLTISGEKKSDQDRKDANFHVMERSYGRFSRSMQLPFMPDPSQVSADFENGVLRIRLRRNEQQQTSQRIQVRSSGSQGQLGQGREAQAGTTPGQRAEGAQDVGAEGSEERSGSSGDGSGFAGVNLGQNGGGGGASPSHSSSGG